jgi:hypothetical protein
MVDHYQDAMPWERMERNARQQGVPLSPNTLANSCGRVIDLFDPVVRDIFHKCVSSGYTAFDATSLPVLDDEHPLGIRSGALWLLQGNHCYSYFMYADSGHAHHLEAKLKGYKLASSMCDGSPTNNTAERAVKTVALGRRAWLFCGSDDHAKSTAALYSLVASATLHRIDAEEYLRCLIRLLPLWPSDRMLELAPLFWERTRAQLDAEPLASEIGPIAIPSEPLDTSATVEQQVPAG